MRPANNIDKLIKKLHLSASAELDERVHSEISRALAESKKTKSAILQPNIWRTIMQSRITKLAAAAVIITAVILGLNIIGGPDIASVAWANVAERVEEIQNYVYRMRQTETSGPKREGFEFVSESETIVYNSLEYGEKAESYTNGELSTRTYSLRKVKQFIGIIPVAKIYHRGPLTESALREMEQMAPRAIVERFMSAEYKELGRETLEGVEIEGIEVNDPKVLKEYPPPVKNFAARLWVDVETELPVCLELEFVPVGSSVWTQMVVDQFQWNVELDASVFEPDIPADYKLETEYSSTSLKPPVSDGESSEVDLPDIEDLNLLGLQDDLRKNAVPLVGMKEIWNAQDEIMSTWPAYSEVLEQLYEELVAKLGIDTLSDEQLVSTAVALREKFWQAGGCLSKTSYPYGYAARIFLEDAHERNPESMAITDELVETIQSIELAWTYESNSGEKIRNIPLRDTLIEFLSLQFEQIKRELEQGRMPTWDDFVRVNDLAILHGISDVVDSQSAKEAADWLIREADRGGWTAYMKPLRKMQHLFNEGERFNYNILRRTKSEFPEEFRYGRRLPSFKGPKKLNATPIHLLESNPVWTGT